MMENACKRASFRVDFTSVATPLLLVYKSKGSAHAIGCFGLDLFGFDIHARVLSINIVPVCVNLRTATGATTALLCYYGKGELGEMKTESLVVYLQIASCDNQLDCI